MSPPAWKVKALAFALMESTNLASTALYVHEAWKRLKPKFCQKFLCPDDSRLEIARPLFVWSSISLACTVGFMVVFHVFLSSRICLLGKEYYTKRCLIINSCVFTLFFVALPLIFLFIFYYRASGIETEEAAEVIFLVVWIALTIASMAAVCLCTQWCVNGDHPQKKDAAAISQSAVMQIPVLNVWMLWHMSEKSPELKSFHYMHVFGLRFFEDIPEVIIASIDLYFFGGSWFAIFDLLASLGEILFWLVPWLLTKIAWLLTEIAPWFNSTMKNFANQDEEEGRDEARENET